MATILAATLTTLFSQQYSDNILPEKWTFDIFGTTLSTIGTGTAQISNTDPFAGDKCLKLTNGNTPAGTFSASLAGVQGQKTIESTGNYPFSFSVKNPAYNVTKSTGVIKIFKNSLEYIDLTFDTGDVFDQWISFDQMIQFQAGDIIDFRIDFLPNATSGVANNYIFIDGFKLELDDRGLKAATQYSYPIEYKANGSCINNSTDSFVITGLTDNLIQIQPDGDMYQNGNLVLLDGNGKVTPIQTGDTYSVDIRFTTVAPTTDAAIVYAMFKVSNQVQRRERLILSNTNGAEEVWNLSLSITCTDSAFGDLFDFLGDGGLFYLNPSEDITVKNCRIEVARTVKGL